MESPNVFEEKDWCLYGLSHWRPVGLFFLTVAKELLADNTASACIATLLCRTTW